MRLCAARGGAGAGSLDATYCAYRRHHSQHAITEPKLNRTLCLELRSPDSVGRRARGERGGRRKNARRAF